MFAVIPLLVSSLTFFLWFPMVPVPPQPGGINKATFERIKIGMTMSEVNGLIGCSPSAYLQRIDGSVAHISTEAFWLSENFCLVVFSVIDWTNHESIEAVVSATFTDNTTSPPTEMKLPPQDTTIHFLIFPELGKPAKRVPVGSGLQGLAQGR
jgi:hypothetical protein